MRLSVVNVGLTIAVQRRGENLASVGFFCARPARACPARRSAAGFAAFGAEINDPVGLLDHVHIVLDDQHGIAERTRRLSTSRSFFTSSKWRPVVGSSRM